MSVDSVLLCEEVSYFLLSSPTVAKDSYKSSKIKEKNERKAFPTPSFSPKVVQ